MRRIAGLIVAAAIVITLLATEYRSRTDLAAAAEGFNGARAFKDLEQLVALGPRPPGSPAIERARQYIEMQIAAAGAEVERDSFTASTPDGPIPMVNIVGVLPGRISRVVIVSGHYETARLRGVEFVGADDGGSSAAELLELARVLSRRSHTLTYWLVFFDGEEAIEHWSATDSLYGSRQFIETLRDRGKLSDIRAVVLLDMVGGRDPQFRPEGNSTPWLRDLVFSAADQLGYRNSFPGGGALPVEDDHLPFLAAGVPAVDIIDFAPFLRGYRHTAQDTIDKCSRDTLATVGRVVLVTLSELERGLKQ